MNLSIVWSDRGQGRANKVVKRCCSKKKKKI